jgi:hypothetical protein
MAMALMKLAAMVPAAAAAAVALAPPAAGAETQPWQRSPLGWAALLTAGWWW